MIIKRKKKKEKIERPLSIYLKKFTTSGGHILQLQNKNELFSFVRVSQSPLGIVGLCGA